MPRMKSAAKIVRGIVTVTGKGTAIFNDRLKTGGRSIKVWGWNERIYTEAVEILKQHGIVSKLIHTRIVSKKWGIGGNIRIHTTSLR